MPGQDLTLRRTVIGDQRLENDYCVWGDKRIVGRIKFSSGRTGQFPGWSWMINIPLPIPTRGTGAADSLEAAMTSFRAAWERFYASLTPEAIEHWHQVDDAATRRWSGTNLD